MQSEIDGQLATAFIGHEIEDTILSSGRQARAHFVNEVVKSEVISVGYTMYQYVFYWLHNAARSFNVILHTPPCTPPILK